MSAPWARVDLALPSLEPAGAHAPREKLLAFLMDGLSLGGGVAGWNRQDRPLMAIELDLAGGFPADAGAIPSRLGRAGGDDQHEHPRGGAAAVRPRALRRGFHPLFSRFAISTAA